MSLKTAVIALAVAGVATLGGATSASAVPIMLQFNVAALGNFTANTGDVTTATTITNGAPTVVGAIQQNNIGLVAGQTVTLAPNPMGVTVGSAFTKSFTAGATRSSRHSRLRRLLRRRTRLASWRLAPSPAPWAQGVLLSIPRRSSGRRPTPRTRVRARRSTGRSTTPPLRLRLRFRNRPRWCCSAWACSARVSRVGAASNAPPVRGIESAVTAGDRAFSL